MNTVLSTGSMFTGLQSAVDVIQRELASRQAEVATGKRSNMIASLGGASSLDVNLHSKINSLQSYIDTNATVSTNFAAAQSAMDALTATANSTLNALIAASDSNEGAGALVDKAKNALSEMTGVLNSSVAGQFIFGGDNSGVRPLVDFNASGTVSAAKQANDDAFRAEFGFSQASPAASSITADQMKHYLDGSFTKLFESAAWSAGWSTATDSLSAQRISPGETIPRLPTANGAATRKLAMAYAMLANTAVDSLSAPALKQLTDTALTTMRSAIDDLRSDQTRIGLGQDQITKANTSMAGAMDLFQTNISSLKSVDPYEAASRVSELSAQLQASYKMTADLQNLSILKFL